MLSISDDSASARNPTWPRLTPSSGMSYGEHPLGAAQDGAVTAQHHHQLDAATGGHRLAQLGDGMSQPAVEASRSSAGSAETMPAALESLDQPGGGLDRRGPTHVGQHADPAHRAPWWSLVLPPRGLAQLTCHSIGGTADGGRSTSGRDEGVQVERPTRLPANEPEEELAVAGRPGQPAGDRIMRRANPMPAAAATTARTAAGAAADHGPRHPCPAATGRPRTAA